MLNDETNYLYLKIVESILYEINQVNLSFQKNNANIGTAYDDLKNLITLLISKILKPEYISNDFDVLLKNLIEESSYLNIYEANYGIEYKMAFKKSVIAKKVQLDLESKAFSYIKKLCMQLSQRLPENLKFF